LSYDFQSLLDVRLWTALSLASFGPPPHGLTQHFPLSLARGFVAFADAQSRCHLAFGLIATPHSISSGSACPGITELHRHLHRSIQPNEVTSASGAPQGTHRS
jgi:hypothetical protein